MITSKYFKEEEFSKASPACSLQDMKQATMDKFDKAREIAGIPFIVNSAYRSVAYEKQQSRKGTSAHTLGCAMDIKAADDRLRFKIVCALFAVGFRRIGVYSWGIHADDSPAHEQDVLWRG